MMNTYGNPAENYPALEMDLSIYRNPLTFYQSDFDDDSLENTFKAY